MKKFKIIQAFSIILFLICFIAVPVICAFIPYREPDIPEDKLEVVWVDDTEAIIYGELHNSTIITISELELHISFYAEDESLISTKKVIIKQVFRPGCHEEFMETIALNSNEANSEYYACTDIYYTYTKPDWYLFFVAGTIVYAIFTVFVSKQKHYFEIEESKFEVYVGGKTVAIVKDGEVVAQQTIQSAYQTPVAFEFNEKKLTVHLSRAFFAPVPRVKIKYDDQPVEIKQYKQHVFIKIVDKKKEII